MCTPFETLYLLWKSQDPPKNSVQMIMSCLSYAFPYLLTHVQAQTHIIRVVCKAMLSCRRKPK